MLFQLLGEAQREGAQMLQAEFLADVIRLLAGPTVPDLPDRLNTALRAALVKVSSPAAPSPEIQPLAESAAN